jgi:branched-chain amino acid aminotransferase
MGVINLGNNLIWLRGEIVPQSSATVPVLSPTSQFGLNVFEGIRCYWNADEGQLYAFRLDDHLRRLMESCRLIRIDPPHAADQIPAFLQEVIAANDFREDAAIRMTVFGDGEGTWSSTGPFSMFIAPIARARTAIAGLAGKAACVSSWERISDNVMSPRIKVGANYINGRYAHLQALEDGYDLPIFLGRDRKVSEGAGACLFMVRHGVLTTPSLTSSVLESITRAAIIEMAKAGGMTVEERPVDRTELYLADEVFLCGSAAEITPITSIDRFPIGSGRPGSVTLGLLGEYHAIASGEDARFPNWRTAVY